MGKRIGIEEVRTQGLSQYRRGEPGGEPGVSTEDVPASLGLAWVPDSGEFEV